MKTKAKIKSKLNLGLADSDRKEIVRDLSILLADTYSVYLMSQNFHWNMTGPLFYQVHLMLDNHYKEMASAIDSIAERIRTLGELAPASFTEFMNLTSIEEVRPSNAEEMILALVNGHEAIVRNARAFIAHTQHAHDEASSDLLASRLAIHEKMAWMLRNLLVK